MQSFAAAPIEGAPKGDGWGRSTYAPIPGAGQTRSCTDPWAYAQILGNGEVRPCCFTGLSLGVINENTSFEEVYNGEVAMRLRRELLTGELDKYCSICNMKAIVPVEEFQRSIEKLHKRANNAPVITYTGNPWERGRIGLTGRYIRKFSQITPLRRLAKTIMPTRLWLYLRRVA